MEKKSIEEMEKLGIADYYLDLSKFLHNFINRNYPLTEEDIKALANHGKTLNITTRKELMTIMNDKLSSILEEQALINQKFLNDLESGKPVTPINIEQYKKEIFNYQQQLLETLYEYKMNTGSKKQR